MSVRKGSAQSLLCPSPVAATRCMSSLRFPGFSSQALRLLGMSAVLGASVAHAQVTEIKGRVLDSSGAVIPNAAVRAHEESGALQTTVSNSAGEFQFPTLPAADYTVEVNAPGFSSYVGKVTLLVGQTLSVDATLTPSSNTVVSVTSSEPSLDVTSSQVAGNIDPQAMKTLPLNGRNWLELSMLVPGVRVNAITNFTPLGTTVSGKFQLNLDGQQVTQNTADPKYGQPQFSRDAISQFQVITDRFDATLGRSSQIYVVAQTKSGSDALHGSAFAYFRDSALNAADPVAHQVLPFQDQQFGGSLGGPIRKQKLWYFGSYEGENQPGTIVSNPLGFPGQYTHPNSLTTGEYLLRADNQVNANNRVFVRGNGYTWNNPYNLASGTTNPSQLYAATRTNYGVAGGWSSTHGASLVNDLHVSFNHFQWTNTPYVNSITFVFPTATIGGPSNYPQNFTQNVQQYRDDVYLLRGKHTLKFGAEYLFNKHSGFYDQSVRGQASCSQDPASYPSVFPNLFDPTTWNLGAIAPLCTTYTQAFGDFEIDVPRNTLGVWIQDDWKISPALTLNLGVRYDNDIGVFDTGLKLTNGLAIKHDGENHNIAPRVGFVADPFGTGRTVIRGGAGIYFADIAANQIINQELFNGVTTVQASVQQTLTTNIDFSAPFGSRTPAQILANPSGILQAPQINDPSVTTPWSFQGSLGGQQQFGLFTFTADGVFTRVYHDWAIRDSNLFYDPATGYNKNPTLYGRPTPTLTTVADSITPAGSIYEALQVGVRQRLARGVTSGLAYTLSEYRNSSTGPFYYPNNPFNLGAEWATATDDQRNTLTATTDYHWRWGLQGGALYHFGSGNAYQTTVGGSSPTGLGSSTTNRTFAARPVPYQVAYGSRACLATQGFACVYTYNNPIHNYLDTTSGFYITSRDAFRGSPIIKLDLHLQKTITLSDRYRVSLIAESFNTLNHSNYGAYSTVVTSSSFGQPATVSGNPPAYGPRALQFSARLDF